MSNRLTSYQTLCSLFLRRDTEMKEEKKIGLSAPWTILFNEYKAMFAGDSNVKVSFDERENGEKAIILYVTGDKKAKALEKLLPSEVKFGNIVVKIVVKPANKLADEDIVQLFREAFDGNEAVSSMHISDNPFAFNAAYIVFKKKVVQFYNDNFTDINGNCSTLYQEIAKDIFDVHDGICFCTSALDDE